MKAVLLALVLYKTGAGFLAITKHLAQNLCKLVWLHETLRLLLTVVPGICDIESRTVAVGGIVARIGVSAAAQPLDILLRAKE